MGSPSWGLLSLCLARYDSAPHPTGESSHGVDTESSQSGSIVCTIKVSKDPSAQIGSTIGCCSRMTSSSCCALRLSISPFDSFPLFSHCRFPWLHPKKQSSKWRRSINDADDEEMPLVVAASRCSYSRDRIAAVIKPSCYCAP